ncbi:response regulator transcription factor [bacterium]|nr:response regulator transcription factor [bacterium]
MSNLAENQEQFSSGATQLQDAPFIYVLEDDLDLQAILTHHLQKEGYRVRCYSKAEDMIRFVDATPELKPEAFVVDINLAGHMNGHEATRYLRSRKDTSKVPLIMLTARGETPDVVKGLNDGADDYIAKPFKMEVLLARLNSCLRRTKSWQGPAISKKEKINVSGIEIDPVYHTVRVLDKDVHLTVTEFGLLSCLMARPNEVLSREDLLLKIMGPNKVVTGRTIDVHIRALREKLSRKAKHVVTVRGVGYKFVP